MNDIERKRQESLDLANARRLEIVGIRFALKRGQLSIEEALQRDAIQAKPVQWLLEHALGRVPHTGTRTPARATSTTRKLLAGLRPTLHGHVPIGSLSEPRRRQLVDAVMHHPSCLYLMVHHPEKHCELLAA